jgi:plastocyanin
MRVINGAKVPGEKFPRAGTISHSVHLNEGHKMSGQSTMIKSIFMKVIKNVIRLSILSIGAVLYGHAISTYGANHQVSTSGLTFVPSSLTINAGDSVTWVNLQSGFHTTTSASSLWDSSSDGFTFTFNNSGTYNYFCRTHLAEGMTGTVTVNAVTPPNQPPMVSITNPAGGIVFSAPASLTLKASATDSDGSVTNVKFLNGTALLGNVAAAPFLITVNNLAAADYTFSAIASDNDGATATNSITARVINPSPLFISAPANSAQNHFQFSYASDIGLTYAVQVSTNLLFGWIPIATNTATTNPTIFTDPNLDNGGSFYRVGRLPNP